MAGSEKHFLKKVDSGLKQHEANLNSSVLVISRAICKSETQIFAYSGGDEVSGRGLRQMLCNANRIIMTKCEIILAVWHRGGVLNGF